MDEITEKDVSELKSKGKKIKIIIKRTLLGVVSAALIFSLLPNVQYQIALQKANNDTYIKDVLSSDETREEKIAKIFEEAINNNENISSELKKRIIDSFTTQVINRAGCFFTDKTIMNMYAVASTEKIKEMSNFSKEHGWWSGNYNPYTNTYSLYNGEESDYSLIAHEQLHAILKNGLINTGFTNGLNGYGINEAATSLLGKNDYSYSDERNALNILSMIIGYNTVLQYYVNSDLAGLKKELNKYIPPEETNKLISNIDLDVFSSYFETFLQKNHIQYNEDKLYERYNNRRQQNIEILKHLFENKYGVQIENSKLGQLIFNSAYFINPEDLDFDKSYYSFSFKSEQSISIKISTPSFEGLANRIINKNLTEISTSVDESKESIIIKELNLEGVVDQIRGYLLTQYGKNKTSVSIQSFSIVVNKDELENFNYEEILNNIISRINNSKEIGNIEDERE